MSDKKGFGFRYWKDGNMANTMGTSPVFSSRTAADEERKKMAADGYMCTLTMSMKAETGTISETNR